MSSKIEVIVTLKNGVLDPQGKAIEGSLKHLGFDHVKSIRQGKFIEVELDGNPSPAEAEAEVKKMCETLLANTVIENFRVVAK